MKTAVLAMLAAAALSATAAAADPDTEVTVAFDLVAGKQPFDCKSPPVPLGTERVPSRLKDARFYIHDLRLVAKDGRAVPVRLDQNEWQFLDLALVDLEDAQGQCDVGNRSTHAMVTGRVPAGDYGGLRFTVGVPVQGLAGGRPVALNHSSTEQTAAPLDIQAMAWNWQAGRKFMKIELAPEGGVQRAADKIKVWPLHLGSTGCVGNPANGEAVKCSSANRFGVVLDGFDAARDRVVLDLAELFGASDIGRDRGGAAGCMSSPQDPECGAIFGRLGLRLSASTPGAGDEGQPLQGQATRIFRVEPRLP